MNVFMRIRRSPVLCGSSLSLTKASVQKERRLCTGIYVRGQTEYLVSSEDINANNEAREQEQCTSSRALAQDTSSQSTQQQMEKAQIAAFWQQHIGCPFRVSGTGPRSYDIYGLIARAIQTARGLEYQQCICRQREDVRRLGRLGHIRLAGPGDVIIFCVCNRCDGCHVGCMINQNQFVHFPDQTVLQVEDLDAYWRSKVKEVRLI